MKSLIIISITALTLGLAACGGDGGKKKAKTPTYNNTCNSADIYQDSRTNRCYDRRDNREVNCNLLYNNNNNFGYQSEQSRCESVTNYRWNGRYCTDINGHPVTPPANGSCDSNNSNWNNANWNDGWNNNNWRNDGAFDPCPSYWGPGSFRKIVGSPAQVYCFVPNQYYPGQTFLFPVAAPSFGFRVGIDFSNRCRSGNFLGTLGYYSYCL